MKYSWPPKYKLNKKNIKFKISSDNKIHWHLIQLFHTKANRGTNITTKWDSDELRETGFGGGGSGLSLNYMKRINEIMTFQSMGAAEYEFGKLAETLIFMEKNIHMYECDYITIDSTYNIYILGLKKDLSFIKERLLWHVLNSKHDTGIRFSLKEPIYQDRMLIDNSSECTGGIDIINSYAFCIEFKPLIDLKNFLEKEKNSINFD